MKFSEILKNANDAEGLSFQENIRKIRNLLQIMNNSELIKDFKNNYEIWNSNKDDQINVDNLTLVLHQISKILYNKAGGSNHHLCLKNLKETFDYTNCRVRDRIKKREFETKFIKQLFQ